MMIGEPMRRSLTIHVPPWEVIDDPTGLLASGEYSPFSGEALAALRRYLPANEYNTDNDVGAPVDAYSCDNFRMFDFKVRKCSRGRSHDWTECPYAHPGEKARRRDPRKYHYSGTACAEFRKGSCKKGDSCEFAHGVFECWLHPARYRTQPCKDGTQCRRRVCFFAHTPEQLRVLSQQSPRDGTPCQFDSYDGSPLRQVLDYVSISGSPNSTLFSPPISPPSDSPPMSPYAGPNSPNELVSALRNLQIDKVKMSSPKWGFPSPRCSTLRPFGSLSPTTTELSPCLSLEEEPAMERVESGRNLRAKIYEKLTRENSLDRTEASGPSPDVGWVSDLLK